MLHRGPDIEDILCREMFSYFLQCFALKNDFSTGHNSPQIYLANSGNPLGFGVINKMIRIWQGGCTGFPPRGQRADNDKNSNGNTGPHSNLGKS